MSKYIRKGIARDKSFIRLVYQCTNGVDTYNEDFLIDEERYIHLGYGYCVRTPDLKIKLNGITYCCFYADGKTITIPFANGREYDGVCYIEKQNN